ncbi:hypothetical protein [Phocaeicola sartorii]|uniref:hypothetical protein n=1 Tax=Phocaeicola sartorii TaxID=671267 RepID=UPI0003AA68AD|nr:hypothetical protein [Phocaeicola sartorii]NUK98856.1 hypothetical protein [Phocaeicola sartorii]
MIEKDFLSLERLLLYPGVSVCSSAGCFSRGWQNPSEYTLKGEWVDVFGRKHSAPAMGK